MTISTDTASAAYTGNGTTAIFPVPFYFLTDADLKVTRKTTSGAVSVLTLNSDYSVSDAGNPQGGSVTTIPALPLGDQIFIERNVNAVQETAYPENGYFPATSHEKALDRLTMLVQQILTALGFKLGRAPLAAAYDAGGYGFTNVADAVDGSDAPNLAQVQALVAGAASGIIPSLIATLTDLASTAAGKGAALLGWIASGTGAVARTVLDKVRELPSVADYGADPTGVVDSTVAFNAALAACDDVYVPPGTYKLADAVNIGSGKRLRGAGRRKTTLLMDATFNGSALGALVFTGGEPGPTVEHLRITQAQPDSTTATVYPPCIYAQATPRFALRSLRLSCVYAGIDMKGNSGGAVIDDLELSPLSIGIDIDGSLDSIKLTKLHLWPFELTTNQRTPYTAAYGIKSGRCDDFHLSDSLLFSVINALYCYNSASGRTFGNVVNVDFDDRGGLNIIGAGDVSMSACVFTQGKDDARLIYMTGGTLNASACRFRGDIINTAANGFIEIVGGECNIAASYLQGLSNNKQFVYLTNASLNLTGCRIGRTANVAYSAAFIRAATNASGSITGNSCAALGSGSSKLVLIDNDYGLVVRGNHANGWTVQTPTGALANTMVSGNLGAGSNKDEFAGYFSGDTSTTVKLPNGWTVAHAGTGNYTVTHNLTLGAVTDLLVVGTSGVAGTSVISDTNGGSINAFKLRAYDATGALVDSEIQFHARRYRS